MITDKDIEKIIEAERIIFATKDDLSILKEEINKSFADLQSAVDKYAKRAEAFFQEMTMLAHKVDRHEQWIHKIAEKLGVKLEY